MKKPPSTKRRTRSSKPVAASQDGAQNDVVLSLLKKTNRPVNLKTYVSLAYFGQKDPEDLGAEEVSELPPELQKEWEKEYL